MREPNFGMTQWIAWMGATLTACVALTAFAYQTFQTKEEFRDSKEDIVRRLDRMENKLDAIKVQTTRKPSNDD